VKIPSKEFILTKQSFVQQGQFRLEIRVNGQAVPVYTASNGRCYVEGRTPSEYTIRVHNDTYERVLFVPSVDGLSVIDGERATEQSGGYVVGPRQYVDIAGWRTSMEKVAKFTFSPVDKSYATQMDKPQDVGVIGILVFREKQFRPQPGVLYSMRRGPMPKGIKGSPESFGTRGVSQGLGTGYGDEAESRVQTTSFDRERQPAAQLLVYYDDREGLVLRGISFRTSVDIVVPDSPQAFAGFCPPPKRQS